MSFNGTEGEFIPMSEASELTKAWRDGDNGPIKGGFLGKDKLNKLLAQPGAMGIRIYFGQDPTNGEKTVALVAAGEDENDMLDLILDTIVPCPSICGGKNGMNSDQ
ncbi:MAG: hypothetical protein ACJASQ_004075 [Crocinitomicaceae bacterium]|jgi:hypothetical protein